MTKDRLRAYTALRREVTQLQGQIAQLRLDASAVRAPRMTGMPGGAPKDGSALEESVMRLLELETVYQDRLEALIAEQLAIEAAIESLDSVGRQLMRARYLDGLKWEEVCVVIGYSWQQTHRLHAQALARLAEDK